MEREHSLKCVKPKRKKYDIFYGNYCHKYDVLNCNFDDAKPYFSHTHNLFLEQAVGKGWPAALLLFVFLFVWAYEMYKKHDVMTVVFIGFIINFLAASQFEYTFHANNLFMIFFLYPISFLKLPERFQLG
jgi:O-antigen ligase